MPTNPPTGLGPSANQRRIIKRRAAHPLWPLVAIGVYLLVYLGALAFVTIGSVLIDDTDGDLLFITFGFAAAMLVLSAMLLLAPVRVATRRPVTRSSLWPALFAGGFVVAALVVAGTFAVIELVAEETDSTTDVVPPGRRAEVYPTWCLIVQPVDRKGGP